MEEKVKPKPNLSILALASFIASFIIARTFTSLYPKIVWEVSGYHVHHFWYGLAMLAIGGWLGISVENERLNKVASILFGAGGGLIADEVGLLLTLESEGYWAETTYTLVIIFLALISTTTLIVKYSKNLRAEFPQFFKSNMSLYLGVFLATVSIAFILETDDITIIAASSAVASAACIMILFYFVQRALVKLRKTHSKVFNCKTATLILFRRCLPEAGRPGLRLQRLPKFQTT
ncbi:MAG: hypothetical protein ACPLZC_02825 [Candidatus Bathyarchaeales archaeon]